MAYKKTNQFKSKLVTFKNTDEGVKKYLTALALIMTMPNNYNRPIRVEHAMEMAKSVRKYGIARAVIAINTGCFGSGNLTYSGDGQHLMYALLNILKPSELSGNLSIQYYEMDDLDDIIPFVSYLNSCAKSWTISEFLNAWCVHGLKDYSYIKSIHVDTKHSISKLIEVFTGKRSNIFTDDFRNGTLKINRKLGQATLKAYDNACSVGMYKNKTSFLAFTRICTDYGIGLKTNYNYFDILNIINNHSDVFSEKLTREEYLTVFRTQLKQLPQYENVGKKVGKHKKSKKVKQQKVV